MIKMNIFDQIRIYKKQKFKKLRVAQMLDIDVQTVRKYWDMEMKDFLAYSDERKKRTRIMDKYEGFVVDKLRAYPDCSTAQIYDWLREHHGESFKPSYASARLFIKRIRERDGIPKSTPFRQYQAVEDKPLGIQAQVDLGSEWIRNQYGSRVRVYAFCMCLSSSRYKFVYFKKTPFTAEDFIYAHDMAFRFFGGRTKEIVYDQDRVLCVSENAGDLLFTNTFMIYKQFAGFEVHLCRAADPESKGKIEAVVKFVKNNFLKHRTFYTIDRLNNEAVDWLDRTGNGLVHNTTKAIPKEVFKLEKDFLQTVSAIAKPPNKKNYLVRKHNVIHYQGSWYSVPYGTYRPNLFVSAQECNDILIISDLEGNELVRHHISAIKGKTVRHIPKEKLENTKFKQLYDTVVQLLGNTNMVIQFLTKNRERYPRYGYDQFAIIKKIAGTYVLKKIHDAIEYCLERELYSANMLKDTLKYFETVENNHSNDPASDVQLPLKYALVTATTRDLSYYTKIYGGNG